MVDANQAGNANYNAAPQVQQSITVNKGNQTIIVHLDEPRAGDRRWRPLHPDSHGDAPGLAVALTLDGTSTGCTLTAGVVNFTAVGTCKIDANQAGNANWNAAPQVQQSITVNKGNQTITFTSTNPSPVTVGGAPYTPTATATSGLAVALTLDGTSTGCTLTAGVVNFTAVGTCVVDANQAGNANWNAAPQVQQSFTVNKGNQTITFTSTNPSPVTVGGATYTAAATATSGLTVTFTSGSTGVCTSGGTNGSVFTFVGTGTCIVDANQGGNANYNAAPQVQQSITVNKGNQTITFTSTNPSPVTVGGAPYAPTATATSGLAVALTLDGTSTGCTLGGGVVSFTAVGTCKIDANQAGNANYNAAPQVQQSITVNKGNQTISFTSTNPSPVTVGGAPYTPTATATSGLAVALTLDGTSTGCTLTAGVVNFTAVGTCVVDANQVGNANYNAAPQMQQSITVKGSQTITFTSTPPTSAPVGGAPYTPTATATSGLAVTFTLDGTSTGCTLTAGVVNFTAAGTCVIDANQAGNATWSAAPQVQQSFSVGLTITSDKYSATGPVLTFSGTGATGANAVTVTVCSVNVFPCTFFNRVSRVLTGTSPTNPWTTAATSALTYGTTYFAQATQAGQTSLVFTFTPTQPAPTDVALANGGTAQKADSGDTATITFNEQLNATTICSAWSNSGIQTVSNATITFTSGAPDSFTATSSTCGGGNFGTVYTGSANYVTGTVTFTNSTIAWNPNNDTLTFTLGTLATGGANVGTNVTAGTPGYALNAAVTDLFGFPASTTRLTSGSASGF